MTERVFITDLEGPISKNDNAFELASEIIPNGDKFFPIISKYDDILADVVKKPGYKAGDTLKLILPFFKAHGAKDEMMEEFSNAFLAKLLTGDGCISINKKNILGGVRIKIYDENLEYLEDYKRIMKNLNFKYIRMDKKHNAVEVNCTLDNLIYFYKNEAFKNTNNWNKLLVIIGFYLNGKRVKIRLRLFDLQNKIFISRYITKNYSLHPENRKWLNNMIKKGYIVHINDKPPFKYKLTKKSEEFISTINKWRVDLNNLIKIKKTKVLLHLWDSLKIH